MESGLLDDCSGVLLAGGSARRMGGIPKGLLQLAGEPIAARTLRLFRELFAQSFVVGEGAERYQTAGVDAIPDRFRGKGAPGGVHAALRAASTNWIFVVACDMPFLETGPIRLLAARRAGARVVLVRFGGRLHPLHALWSQACLPTLEPLLLAGNPSLVEAATAIGPCVVEETEWQSVDVQGHSLENANTPEDAARLGLVYKVPNYSNNSR